jgi:phosphomannomutase/phosphoglucomutase
VKNWKEEKRVIDLYVKGVVNEVDKELIKKKEFRVVVDGANSVGSITTPLVLKELGVKVLCVNCNLDPSFPGREPEPTVTSLNETSKVVKSIGADLLVAHDADADRAIIGDEVGSIHWGDRSGALLTYHLVQKYPQLPKRTFTGVSSSHFVVEGFLKPRGIEIKWTPVGSVIISHMLIKEGGASGFEENGGFMNPVHHPVRDGGMTAALFLEMMAKENKRASELFSMLPKAYAKKGKVLRPPKVEYQKLYEKLSSMFPDCRKWNIDGLKVACQNFWFLVRPSGTEPVMRIMVESKDPKELEKMYLTIEDVVKRALEEAR